MAPLGSKLREGLQHNKKTVKTVLIICVVIVAVTTTVIIIVVYFIISPSSNFEKFVSDDMKTLENEELNLKKTLSVRIWSAPQSDSKYPFMAFLIFNWNTTEPVYFCGGTIINERTILTAAHCIHNATSVDVTVGISRLDDATNSMLYGGQLIIHEEYNDKNYDNDIGLIQLDTAMKLNDYTNVAFLNFINNVHHRVKVSSDSVVLGWGLNKSLGLSNELLIKHVHLTDNEDCFKFYKQDNFVSDDSKILCTVNKAEGPCYSDSGGPLLVLGNVQIGLVSAGDENCTPNSPTRYMNIAFYRKWIEKYISSSYIS